MISLVFLSFFLSFSFLFFRVRLWVRFKVRFKVRFNRVRVTCILYIDRNAPISDVENMSPLQFAHLICIFENYLDELAWISFAKFETKFF